MSDDIPRLAAHGRIIVKPEIARYEGEDVVFVDGTREAVDLIVFATGYKLQIPFLDQSLYLDANGKPRLYLNAVHPERENLFFAGLLQANGAMWRLADYQGRLFANAIVAQKLAPDEYKAFRAEAATGESAQPKTKFVASDRHVLEHNYYDFARILKRRAAKFMKACKLNYPAASAASQPANAVAAE